VQQVEGQDDKEDVEYAEQNGVRSDQHGERADSGLAQGLERGRSTSSGVLALARGVGAAPPGGRIRAVMSAAMPEAAAVANRTLAVPLVARRRPLRAGPAKAAVPATVPDAAFAAVTSWVV
jgi:hypothetical protein